MGARQQHLGGRWHTTTTRTHRIIEIVIFAENPRLRLKVLFADLLCEKNIVSVKKTN
jgi:hypothetical protein